MKKALFLFGKNNTDKEILFKFNLWARYFFPKYFTSRDAPFHKEMDLYNLQAYRGELISFVNITFRGGAKTVRTKLFIAFCIANDEGHLRKYIKVLSADIDNCIQITTDIYNMLINTQGYYNLFEKTSKKREERMSSFTTSTGIKMKADTVGTEQRGSVQEEARIDLIWYEDFESRTTLRSAIKTKMIADNMEEARTGLAIGGSSIYTANYISEAGNVHNLIHKKSNKKKVLIIPIIKNGKSQWDRYSLKDIENMRKDDEDFEGERLCKPDAGKDIYFNRDMLDKQVAIQPIKDVAGFKIFKKYNPAHRYAGGHDVAGGVQLDSSTSVFIDFDTIPAQVVGIFASNTIAPEAFGDEIYSEGNIFGGCILGIENNKYDQTILKAKILGAKLYMTQPKAIQSGFKMPTTYGWNTNTLTKSQMMSALREAIDSGLIDLNDKDLIQEAKSYTRNDIIDKEPDARLTTRHFDILTACFVKGTLVLTDKGQKPIENICVGDMVMTRNGYRKVKTTISHIKKVITNIGLTGTPDHPIICNNNQIKNLTGISKCDILYIWNIKTQKIEKLSYTKAQNIIDTQIQKYEHIGSILWGERSGKSRQFICIEKYGLIILGLFQKGLLFIIKIIIQAIMILKTFVCCLPVSICDYICQIQRKRNNSEKILRKTEKKSTKGLKNIIKINPRKKLFVVFAENYLRQFQTMLNSVQGNARKELEVKEGKNQKKKRFVQFVGKCLKPEFHIKKDVPKNAALCEKENIYQRVFNIEVEDTPEYFVNNVLVHNCAIAWMMKEHARMKVGTNQLSPQNNKFI